MAVASTARPLIAALSIRRRKTSSSRVAAGPRAQLVRRPGGEEHAVAEQEELVAALGLVHHVTRDEQASAARRRAGGRDPRGRGAAPGRARRSARRARAARARRAAPRRAILARAGHRRAGRRHAPRSRSSATVSTTSSIRAPLVAEQPGEVAQVLAHGQVGIDRRRLRHVADAAPQRGCAGGTAEHDDATARRPAARRRSRA